MTIDMNAPDYLKITVEDMNGKFWGTVVAKAKNFSTGSHGYNITGKILNPDDEACRYQFAGNLVLCGSKNMEGPNVRLG